jgi:hypothetical protein
MLVQLVGAVAVLVGGTWAMGPWFLLVAGAVFLVVPELLERPAKAPGGPRAVQEVPAVPGWRERRRRAS